jgi:hypothetical protein
MAVALAATFWLSLALDGTASARTWAEQHSLMIETGVPFPCPGAQAQWLSFNSAGNTDSPLDSNLKAWRLTKPAGCYVQGSTWASLVMNVPIAQVKNLSFEWRTPAGTPPGSVGGFSPRLDVGTSAGSLSLDAENCRWNISGTWARSDFTGFKSTAAVCTIYDPNFGTEWVNTPTMSAWQVFVAAHPGATLTSVAITVSGLEAGTYYLDRISLGTGRLYAGGNLPSKPCTTEGSC